MNNPNKRFTKTQGILTNINIIASLALITWGVAYTKHTHTLALTTLAFAFTVLLALVCMRKLQTNERRYLLPNDYSEQLEAHAKYTIDPRQIILSKFHSHSKTPFTVGSPQRITIKHGQVLPIDVTDFSKIIDTLNLVTGNVYKINRKKSKDRGLLVLDALTPEQLLTKNSQPELTFRENIEQRLRTAANNLLGENTIITAHWQDDDQYLTNVEITGFDSTIIALPNKRKQILMQLRSTLPKGDFNTFADPHEQKIIFSRSRPLPTVTAPPAQRARLIKNHEDYLNFKVYYGTGPNDAPAYWQPSKDAHLLCIGAPGGGKTIFQHGVIQQLAQAGARVWLLDGKRVEFKGYRHYPNIEILAQKIEHQIRLVKMAFDLMEERYTLIEQDKVTIAELEPVFLVIDEVKTFLQSAERLYKKYKVTGMPAQSEVLDWLSDMGSLARTAKVHMVFGLQRPDAEFIGGELRDNFGARVSMGQLQSSQGSLMMWNNPAIGVQVPKIPGRAISLVDGVPGQIQVPFTANPDPQHKDFVPSMVAANYPVWEIYSRKIIEEAKPEMILNKKGEPTGETAVTWNSIMNAKVRDPKTDAIVEIPVVASDESRTLRASDAHDIPVDESQLIPREINDFSRALAIFDDTTNLSWGSSVARAIVAFKHLEKSNYENGEAKAAEAYAETLKRLANSELAFDEEQEIKSSDVKGGMRVTDPATGEKILVSDTQHLSESDQVIVTGYTEDGEQVSIEVDAGQRVECATLIGA